MTAGRETLEGSGVKKWALRHNAIALSDEPAVLLPERMCATMLAILGYIGERSMAIFPISATTNTLMACGLGRYALVGRT